MTTISIIGLGTYARAIGARGVEAGHAVEVIGRDAAKAKDLADELGGSATAGTFGTAPTGDIVVLAVPYASAMSVVAKYGDALAVPASPHVVKASSGSLFPYNSEEGCTT